MVDVWLPYGETEVCLRVSARSLIETLTSREAEGVEDPRIEVEKALDEPIGTGKLKEIAKSRERAAIIIKNSTEVDAQLNRIALECILGELSEAGIRAQNIRVLVGYDPLTTSREAGIEALTRDGGLGGVEISIHDPSVDGDHVEAGRTRSGTRLRINRAYMEADLKISVGFVELHPYAGYGGGREAILPGISDLKAVRSNQALALNPRARMGLLDGNPVHEDMVEAAEPVGVDFALNMARNSLGRVVGASSGSLDESFMECVRLLDGMYRVEVERRADVVFWSPGGSPHDSNLYRASLGLSNALTLLKRDGILVLVAECLDGYGDEAFYKAMAEFRDSRRLERSLRRRFTAGGYVAYRLMKVMEMAEVLLVSALPDYYALDVFRLKTHRTVNEALRYALDRAGRNSKVTAVVSGNTVIPAPSRDES